MKKYYICFLLYIMVLSNLNSQNIKYKSIDFTKFPIVTVAYNASDTNINSYSNLSIKDFNIMENGISMNSSASLIYNSNTFVNSQLLAITFVIDVSGSMNEPIDTVNPNPQFTRAKLIQNSINYFLNNSKFKENTYFSLITFSTQSSLRSGFTTNKFIIIDSLRKTIIAGVTKYDPSFLDTTNGTIGLYRNLPNNLIDSKKVIVFLTDGDPDPQPDVNKIVNQLSPYSAKVYSMTIFNPMNIYLKQISDQTGGKAYVVLNSDNFNPYLDSIASDISLPLSQNYIDLNFNLSWISPFSCDNKNILKNVETNFIKKQFIDKLNFIVPKSKIPSVQFSNMKIQFGNQFVGSNNYKSIKVKVNNQPFAFGNISITPNNNLFSISDISLNGTKLKAGDIIPFDSSFEIEILFNPKVLTPLTTCKLTINGLPCNSFDSLILEGSADLANSVNDNEIYPENVYPNPTSGIINISNNSLLLRVQCTITNQLGEVLNTINIHNINNQSQIDLSEYPKGIYFFKTQDKVYKVVKE